MGFEFRIHQASFSEVDDNGFINIQYDAFGEKKSGVPAAEAHHPFGFMSRPDDPQVDANGEPQFGCNVLVGYEGEQAHVWLASDPRSRLVLPVIQRGESIIFGAGGNFIRCHRDGRLSMFTSDDGTTTGKTVAFQVKPDGFIWSAPWGKMTFDATGFHMLHSSGAAIDAGAIGGLPAPLSALGSYVKLTAAMVQLEASIIANGVSAGASEPATKATTLAALLATMQAVLALIGPAVSAAKASSMPLTPDPAGAALAAFTTALAALTTAASASGTAVAAAPLTISSASSGVT